MPKASAGFAIEAENLTCRFGNFTAVDHVSFQIRRGEIFGFLGSNGCGKSTTMKMLTGLLAPSEGEARLFGEKLDANDMATRRRVGYMSQNFSLYSELTVRQNLTLHAQLFELQPHEVDGRVNEMLERFGLREAADARPESLPLGMRQRLQLAVAVIHRPDLLILDEPTSGVDPIARDSFWRMLIRLSREDGVTIFISTHFMNEAERCDRISLMHAGKVLAMGAPAELVAQRGKADLEETFISYLEAASKFEEPPEEAAFSAAHSKIAAPRTFDLARFWAYARRETMEILRDRVRLAFAIIGPLVLMLTFGYGISFDVENLAYAVYDQDNSLESRELLENFSGSRYFQQRPDIVSTADLERRLTSGELKLAVEIPAGFGKDLVTGKTPKVAVWIDGAMPFRAETIRSYVAGISQVYLAEEYRRRGLISQPSPLQVGPLAPQVRQAIHHVLHQMKAVQIVLNAHVEGRGDRAFFLVAPDMEIWIGPPVGQAMDQPGISVEGEDDVLVFGEKVIVIRFVQPVGVLARRLQLHEIDDVDDPDFEIGQMLAKDRDRGQNLKRRRLSATGHHDVRFGVLIVARPLPDADAFGAMHGGGVHGQPLRESVFASHRHVDIMPAAQAVIEDRQQTVGSGGR